jgi:hypothetical protein
VGRLWCVDFAWYTNPKMRPIGSLDAFALGLAAGWLVTYLSLTHEKRTIKSVRKAVLQLATYHDVTPGQYRTAHEKGWATDEEVWEAYCWVQRFLTDRRYGFAP